MYGPEEFQGGPINNSKGMGVCLRKTWALRQERVRPNFINLFRVKRVCLVEKGIRDLTGAPLRSSFVFVFFAWFIFFVRFWNLSSVHGHRYPPPSSSLQRKLWRSTDSRYNRFLIRLGFCYNLHVMIFISILILTSNLCDYLRNLREKEGEMLPGDGGGRFGAS